jgi:hypothetical protein
MESTGNSVYKKLQTIMSKVRCIKRDANIKLKSGESYPVNTYESVLDIIRPLLIEEKLLIVRTSAKSTVIGNIAVVDAEYDIIDTETGDKITMASIGSGHDTSDKHTGKAMTYALKYALRDLFLLRGTDDDSDLSASDRNVELDMKAKLTNEFVVGLVNQAINLKRIDAGSASNLIRSIQQVGEDKAELERAREYIKSTLGV